MSHPPRERFPEDSSVNAASSGVQTVLIVDDDPSLRSVLTQFVREIGAIPIEAENGVSALARARHAQPDLILLDVDMPLMDGRATLAMLKDDPGLRGIPVIMVSGAGESDIAVECIEAGAEDFVSKPFKHALLQARVRSTLERTRLHARERAYQRQVERYGLELEERVRQKTRDLAEAHERLSILDKAKDDFLSLIAHELRTPVTGALGASEALWQGDLDESGRRDAAELLQKSVERLLRIVEDALLLTSIKVSADEFSLEPHPMQSVMAKAMTRASVLATMHGVHIAPASGDAGWVLCEERMLSEALAALLESAVKFSAPDQAVEVACARSEDSVLVSIRATGHKIPPDVIPRFFEVLSLVEPLTPGGDLGLGPPVAAQILRLLGGSVAVEATEDGIRFALSLRATHPPAGCANP